MTEESLTASPERSTPSGSEQQESRIRPIVFRKIFWKLLVELGPLLSFFIAYDQAGIFWATGIFMAVTLMVSLPSWLRARKLPLTPMVSAVLVVVMGGLTLALGDESYITVRPTVINLLFAAALFWGLWTGRPLLKMGLGDALDLTERGWRGLTFRLAVFLVFLALLNEVVWRTQPLDVWVAFKTFAVIPLDLLFVLAMWPYVRRHQWRHGQGTVPLASPPSTRAR